METQKKLENLKSIIRNLESVIVAYSGGVDSTFLLKVTTDILKDRALAVIGRSPSYPEREYMESIKIAGQFGAKCITIETQEIDDSNYSSNPKNRCYYCKSELFTKLLDLAREKGYGYVLEGSNLDDVHDYRPGMEAACDMGIKSPLKESGLTKDEIRALSKEMNLSTWDKPSQPCLSSRFPYGTELTRDRLKMVEQAEQFLFDLGLKEYRVRFHKDLARIELLKNDMDFVLREDVSEKIIKRFKEIGFIYIAMDIQGYRMGSMNEALKYQ